MRTRWQFDILLNSLYFRYLMGDYLVSLSFSAFSGSLWPLTLIVNTDPTQTSRTGLGYLISVRVYRPFGHAQTVQRREGM